MARDFAWLRWLSCAAALCFTIKWFDESAVVEPLAQFAASVAFGVMVDCGSSGSRVYVYGWPAEALPGRLLRIRELNSTGTRPGLSELADDAALGAYLDKLLRFAAEVVPAAQHADTPLFVLCTAGLRRLPQADSELLLARVRRHLHSHAPFQLQDSHVQVISGKQEATYSWLTANYLLGRFGSSSSSSSSSDSVCLDAQGDFADRGSACRPRTVGTVEMGGASMQLAFELPPAAVRTFRDGMLPLENFTVQLDLACEAEANGSLRYHLYAATYLNFGANAARDRYVLSFLRNARKGANASDPCLPTGVSSTRHFSPSDMLAYSSHKYGLALDLRANRSVTLTGSGNYLDCLRRINDSVLRLSCRACGGGSVGSSGSGGRKRACAISDRCTVLGNWQPSVAFHRQPFYGFSDFYYRYTDFYGLRSGNYNESLFRSHNTDFCSKSYTQLQTDYNETISAWLRQSNRGWRFAEAQLQSQCFQAAYAYAVLHYAFKFPTDFSNLTLAGNIAGSQLQWTLGAMLYKTRNFPSRYKRNVCGGAGVASSVLGSCGVPTSTQSTKFTSSTESWLLQNNIDLAILAIFIVCCVAVGILAYVIAGKAKRNSLRLRSLTVDFDQQSPTSV